MFKWNVLVFFQIYIFVKQFGKTETKLDNSCMAESAFSIEKGFGWNDLHSSS